MTNNVAEVEYKDVIVIFREVVESNWDESFPDLIYFGSCPDKIDKFINILKMIGVYGEFTDKPEVNCAYWMKREETDLVENLFTSMGDEIETFSALAYSEMPAWVFEMYEAVRADDDKDVTEIVRSHYVK